MVICMYALFLLPYFKLLKMPPTSIWNSLKFSWLHLLIYFMWFSCLASSLSISLVCICAYKHASLFHPFSSHGCSGWSQVLGWSVCTYSVICHTHTHTHICGLFISDQWGENEPKVCSHPNLTPTRGKFLLGSQRAKTYISPLDSQMYGISFPPILDAISASFQHSTRVGWPTDLVCLHWRWYLGHKTFSFEVEMSWKKKKKNGINW